MTIAIYDLGGWVFGLLAISSVKALVLALPAWVALRLLRPIRPALEHGVWTAVLAGMLLLPLTGLKGLLPEPAQSMLQTEVVRLDALAAVAGGSGTAAASMQGPLQSCVGLAYLLVLCVFVGRLALGRLRATRLVAKASEITDAEARGTLNALIASNRLTKKVTLLTSSAIHTPVTFGCRRAVVVLPDAWGEWSTGKLRGVLAHELSHLARRDAWIAVAAALNCTLFWFHPMSWWLRTRLTSLAELACDDRSVLLTKDREGYAETLLSIASRSRKREEAPFWPVPAMARTSRVAGRIERILSIATLDSGLLGRPALTCVSAAMVAWLLVVGFVSPAWAQQGITLSGTVQDASGARIPQAMVFVSDVENPQSREVTTARRDGTYSLSGLWAGRQYKIEAHSPGFVAFHDIVSVYRRSKFRHRTRDRRRDGEA